jgi:glycosyltransferase involved in cell wall biosynthesis
MLNNDYNVKVLSLAISKKKVKYSYETDDISYLIHNSQIIKIKNENEIIEHINTSSYKFIINNKMNEFFSLLPKLNSNIQNHVISHNSMDPFNELIINNQNYISRIFTINNFHNKLIKKHITNIDLQTHIYLNHVKIGQRVTNKKQFSNKVAFVGRLSREKGVNILLQAFISFIEKYNKNIELIIIGDCKGDLKTSEYYIDHKNILYLGKLNEEQIKLQILKCDYLILPSYTEGIPFVILEAMSIGIPCIYSNINGANEIIDDKETGFLFDLCGYSEVREIINSWKVFEVVDKYFDENVINLSTCLNRAYEINIAKWNTMSEKSYTFISLNYSKTKTETHNKILINQSQLKPKNICIL